MSRCPALLAIILIAITSSFAGDVRLVAIHVKGSHEFSEAEVARASGLVLNQTIGPAEFKDAADRLVATGAFASVGYRYGPQGSGMFVEFQLEDAPTFLPVRYENFVWLTDSELGKELSKRVPLFHGKLPEGGGLVNSVTAAMTAMLAERGVAGHGEMRLHTPAPGKPVDAVSLYVDGIALPVREIDFVGASKILVPQLNEAVKPLLGTNFDLGALGESINYRLTPFYQSRGMLKAAVDPPTASMLGDPKKPDVKLTVHVHEGQQYSLRQLRWTGDTAIVSEAGLRDTTKVETDKILNYLDLLKGVRKATDLYAYHGYLEAKIDIQPSYDDNAGTVDYTLNVAAGRHFRMGRFTVAGFPLDICEELQQRWKIPQGQLYDSTAEEIFLSQNKNITHNRTARIIETPHPDGTVDISMQF